MNWLIASPAFLMTVGIGSLIVTVIVLAIRDEKKRRETLSAFVSANGFEFAQEAESPQAIGLPEIELFSRGGDRQLTDVMVGEIEGSAVRILEYSYTEGSSGDSEGGSSTHQQTVVAVSVGGAALPNFTLAREQFFHKIGQAFGYQDIDFDDFPEFSKKYLLRGEDEASIRSLFTQRLIEAYTSGLDCNVEVRSGWLFVYQHKKRIKPQRLQLRIEGAFSFLFEMTGAPR